MTARIWTNSHYCAKSLHFFGICIILYTLSPQGESVMDSLDEWGSDNVMRSWEFRINARSPNTGFRFVASIIVIYLLKFWFPMSDQRATTRSPHENSTLWRGNLKNYRPSFGIIGFLKHGWEGAPAKNDSQGIWTYLWFPF